MGNHEFCTECHENDFHYGRPCDPEKRAKVVAAEEAAEKARKVGAKNLQRLADWLYGLGLDVEIGGHYESEEITIRDIDLSDADMDQFFANAQNKKFKLRKRWPEWTDYTKCPDPSCHGEMICTGCFAQSYGLKCKKCGIERSIIE